MCQLNSLKVKIKNFHMTEFFKVLKIIKKQIKSLLNKHNSIAS